MVGWILCLLDLSVMMAEFFESLITGCKAHLDEGRGAQSLTRIGKGLGFI